MTMENAYYVGIHSDALHPYEPALIIGVEVAKPHRRSEHAQPCFRVRYANGHEILVPIDDPEAYEVLAECDVDDPRVPIKPPLWQHLRGEKAYMVAVSPELTRQGETAEIVGVRKVKDKNLSPGCCLLVRYDDGRESLVHIDDPDYILVGEHDTDTDNHTLVVREPKRDHAAGHPTTSETLAALFRNGEPAGFTRLYTGESIEHFKMQLRELCGAEWDVKLAPQNEDRPTE